MLSPTFRILSGSRWSELAVARLLLLRLVATFVPIGPVVIGLDDTIERRWYAKIAARGIYRDPVRSSHGHFVKASGLALAVGHAAGTGALGTAGLGTAGLGTAGLGGFGRVRRIVKLGVYVNSAPDFIQQPQVANGASELMVALFGDAGRHARSAVGVPVLPLGSAVEVDAIVELGASALD